MKICITVRSIGYSYLNTYLVSWLLRGVVSSSLCHQLCTLFGFMKFVWVFKNEKLVYFMKNLPLAKIYSLPRSIPQLDINLIKLEYIERL